MPCHYWLLIENSHTINDNVLGSINICRIANNGLEAISGRIQAYSWINKISMVRDAKTN